MPFEAYLKRYSRPLLGLIAILVLGLLPGLFQLRSNNSPQVFFIQDLQQLGHYQELRHHFGSDHVLRIVIQGEGLWTETGLLWLGQVEEQCEALHGVEWAGGLAGHHRRSGWPPADPLAFRQRVLDNQLDRNLGAVSTDGLAVTILVALADPETVDSDTLVAALSQLLASPPPGIETHLVGLPILNQALDQSSLEIVRRFFPLLVLFALLLLGLGLRHPSGVLIPLAFVGFCELLVMAPMGYAGVELNLVMAVLPPLLFVISLATALHIMLHFRIRVAHEAPVAACVATYRDKGWSVLWTGLSTMIGFASLTLSPVAPVRSLGLWATVGLALMTLAAFGMLPFLLVAWPPPAARKVEYRFQRFGAALGLWSCRYRRLILLTAAVAAAVAIAGIPRIEVETNALRYLAAEHPVRADMERLEKQGIGLATLEVLIKLESEGFLNADQIEQLAEFTDRFQSEPFILGSVSAGSLLREALGAAPTLPFVSPSARRALAWQILERDEDGQRMIRGLLTDDRHLARVTIFVPARGFDELDPVFVAVRRAATESFPTAQVEITGQYPLLLEGQRHLLYTLGTSFGLTLLGVSLILRFLLPGTRLAFLALLPNLWPVVGVLGIMGWAEIPLDIATVMVASVVLGLAVDDTLHTLGHFRTLAPGRCASRAVIRTLSLTAPAYLLTGVILVAGFGVCALSDFAPTARFGYLAAFAIVLAVIGDLFLLPALLSLTPQSTLARWNSPPKS
jgi:predicted RND superfamily exporter protein